MDGHRNPRPTRPDRPQLPRPAVRRAPTRPPGPAAHEGMDAMSDLPPARDNGTGHKTETDAVLRAELPADRTSGRQARTAIRQALAAWQMEHLSGDAELLASELVA